VEVRTLINIPCKMIHSISCLTFQKNCNCFYKRTFCKVKHNKMSIDLYIFEIIFHGMEKTKKICRRHQTPIGRKVSTINFLRFVATRSTKSFDDFFLSYLSITIQVFLSSSSPKNHLVSPHPCVFL